MSHGGADAATHLESLCSANFSVVFFLLQRPEPSWLTPPQRAAHHSFVMLFL